ncbi:hypothetical protein BVRB_6g129140 [Beta vulgaris subsp. vulgaris]|nr:hypothetical protein BVRB_6g129140 [Beta vulgaris subsp. vulgaris]
MATVAAQRLQVNAVVRPLAHFPPDIWENRFDNFTIEDELKMEMYAKDTESLKKEVLLMLLDDSTDLAKKMSLIDAVQRLGFSYYYEIEINNLLDRIFKEFAQDNFKMDYDLCETASQFRIFRQYGYKIPIVTWVKTRYVPTYEEYMVNGRVTSGVQVCVTGSLLGMDEISEEKPYAQLMQAPKAVEACEYIVRLMDDIVTREAELTRGCRLATSVECYMKDYNKSLEEVIQIFKKKMDDAWKDLAQEGLMKNNLPDDNNNHFSKPVYDRILNYGRVLDAMYKDADGYTLPETTIKEDIIITYSKPFSKS